MKEVVGLTIIIPKDYGAVGERITMDANPATLSDIVGDTCSKSSDNDFCSKIKACPAPKVPISSPKLEPESLLTFVDVIDWSIQDNE